MSTNNDAELLGLLRCPDCGGALQNRVLQGSRSLECVSCRREFPVTEESIYCLLPLNPPKLPPDYDDPDYKRMSAMFDDASDYFTDGNSIFQSIHNSAHQTIARWQSEDAQEGWTCDLGCGTGYHYKYLKSFDKYVGLDIRLESLRRMRHAFPDAHLVQANSCALPFHDRAFSTIISVYALEHIYHLEQTVEEMLRLLQPNGRLLVGLPCEGGLAWTLGRKITSEREMSKRYNLDYRKYIALEHCNKAADVLKQLKKRFSHEGSSYFPLPIVPLIDANLTVAAAFRKAGA